MYHEIIPACKEQEKKNKPTFLTAEEFMLSSDKTMDLFTGAPWCMLGLGGRACFWLQEFSLTRKWISWQTWNLACFRFLKDRRNSLGLIQMGLFLWDSQKELSLYLSQDYVQG